MFYCLTRSFGLMTEVYNILDTHNCLLESISHKYSLHNFVGLETTTKICKIGYYFFFLGVLLPHYQSCTIQQ